VVKSYVYIVQYIQVKGTALWDFGDEGGAGGDGRRGVGGRGGTHCIFCKREDLTAFRN
jgi:hypothetical protein